jgi:hypothetical protein
MTEPILTVQSARALHLAAQGMLRARRARATPADVLDAIRRMDMLQIDTISVVARSPYLVLFSRLGDYDPVWLEQLLEDGKLFEYWAHEACFIPIGRIDAKAHRKAGVFELKSVAFEAGLRLSERLLGDVAQAVLRCARWHRCPEVAVGRAGPSEAAAMLAAALAAQA